MPPTYWDLASATHAHFQLKHRAEVAVLYRQSRKT